MARIKGSARLAVRPRSPKPYCQGTVQIDRGCANGGSRRKCGYLNARFKRTFARQPRVSSWRLWRESFSMACTFVCHVSRR
jgi:hypothetical protein